MARIRILALKQDNNYINLFTSIVEETNFKKQRKLIIKENILPKNKDIIVLEFFITENKLIEFKNNIIEKQELICGKFRVIFNVDKLTRHSFLPIKNDLLTDSEKQMTSCFEKNCQLLENWCLDDSVKNIWLKFNEAERKELSMLTEINLFYMIDRIGNILHFIEIEEIDVTIFHQNNKFITFSTSLNGKFIPNKYCANIEIKSFDDIILKECFIITERFKDFELQDEDYNIFIEVYNIKTGKCVYMNNFVFMKELSMQMNIPSTEIVFKDKKGSKIHSIQTYCKERISSVVKNDKSQIVQYQLARSSYVRKQKDMESLTFQGFKGRELKEAEKYFQNLLKKIANTAKGYIYIADPYFLNAEFDIRRFMNYMDIFATIQDKEVRILTCSKDLPKSLRHFRKNNTKQLFKNVKIKSILELSQIDKKEISSFHDRWLASDIDEYGFTNSLNNFKNGVSFFKSSKHYFEEAEELWQISSDNQNYVIQEFNLYE